MTRLPLHSRGPGLACLVLCLLARSLPGGIEDPKPAAPPAVPVDFVRDVRPILARNCYECHGEQKKEARLRLDRKARALAGGDSGPILEPGKADESLLIERVTSDDPMMVMPPKGERLTPNEVATLRAWIDQGASWPDGVDLSAAEIARAQHWAFRAPRRPDVPAVKDRAWVRNPIDTFVLAKLEAMGIAPSPEARRRESRRL
jgi:hypothetical protein